MSRDLPDHLPELIICRNYAQRDKIRAATKDRPQIRVLCQPTIAELMGRAIARVTVCEGVYIDSIRYPEGPLREILRQRMMTWGDRAMLIEL